ncbi:MAG: hypothetical protein ABSE99_09765 [Terracidiphilus sp.]
MKADPRFVRQPREFWAHVRTISQEVGYTDRRTNEIRIPKLDEIREEFRRLGLSTAQIADDVGELTPFGRLLFAYFIHRANILNHTVQGQLMDKAAAQAEFKRLQARFKPKCPLPMNKQKGDKKNYAFMTCIVNMLVQANIGDAPCDYDPRSLTTITQNAKPLRTLARRVDGAFPSVVNPVGIWEIKEYYYTTTFGSRVADGVYETLLDGMELEELEAATGRKVFHLLILDDYFTWWKCGRSYLCRMIDMLHMGFVDEVIFGREVLTRLPQVVREWVTVYGGLPKNQ